MKYKIAFVCPRSPREIYAGVENYVSNLTQALKKKYDVSIYCTAKNPLKEQVINGIKYYEFKEDKLPFGIHYYSKELIEKLKSNNHDLIHASGYNTMAPIMALKAKKNSQKLIITLASSKSSSKIRNALEKIYFVAIKSMSKKVDYFIALSKFEKDQFEKKFNKAKFSVIPIGHEYKQKNIKKAKSKQILSVGRLVKNKGFQYVLEAFKEATKKDHKIKLLIVGDGDYRKKLEEKTQKLGLKGKVNFLGAIGQNQHDRILKLMDESALFIFLSNYESQGLVVEEAICAGTPTIVADTSAIREFAECNLAFAFKQNESKKIAKKMIEIINNPQKHAPKISNIKKCYLIKNWKQVCTNTDQIYMKVLGKQ